MLYERAQLCHLSVIQLLLLVVHFDVQLFFRFFRQVGEHVFFHTPQDIRRYAVMQLIKRFGSCFCGRILFVKV